jgi:hypothetical protein
MPLIAMSVHILFSLRIFRGSFYSGLWRYWVVTADRLGRRIYKDRRWFQKRKICNK